MTANGFVVYRGSSRLDGAPVVVIVTGIRSSSANEKTGRMAQTWILRADIHPVLARHVDADASVCGDCPLANSSRNKGKSGPRCYVNVGFGPASVYRAFLRGAYPDASPKQVGRLAAERGLAVRVGSYGDPAAVPASVWRQLTGARHTGYSHQWRRRPSLRATLMASADSLTDARQAWAQGWRTFRVIASTNELEPNEILCPASAQAGKKTHCANCLLCNGATPNDRRKSVAIVDHGPTAKRAHA